MQKQNNIQNETSMCKVTWNGSDDSAQESPSRESSGPSWENGRVTVLRTWMAH